jgi:hypothetical protein
MSNVHFYMLSMFEIPKGPCNRIDFFRKRLLCVKIVCRICVRVGYVLDLESY